MCFRELLAWAHNKKMSRRSPARRPNVLNLGKLSHRRSAFTPMTNGVYSPVTDLAINLNELTTR